MKRFSYKITVELRSVEHLSEHETFYGEVEARTESQAQEAICDLHMDKQIISLFVKELK